MGWQMSNRFSHLFPPGVTELSQQQEEIIPSPCQAKCERKNNYCTTCFRHQDEVTGWRNLDNIAKKQVLFKIELRKLGYYS